MKPMTMSIPHDVSVGSTQNWAIDSEGSPTKSLFLELIEIVNVR